MWDDEEDSRIIINNKINKKFLALIKEDIQNPFSSAVLDSKCKVGIEFEFYFSIPNSLSVNERIDYLDDKVNNLIQHLSFFNDTIEILPDSYEIEKNPKHAYLEKDSTLEMSKTVEGFEFVSPMLDLKDVPFYFKTVCDAINSNNGFTNKGCGLHFHISSKSLKEIDMAKFMTFLNEEDNLLAEYHNRSEYAKPLNDIFKSVDIKKFNRDIVEQDKHFDIVLLGKNHIEVRSFGGADIYKDSNKVLNQLKTIMDTYRVACTPSLEKERYVELVQRNKTEYGFHKDNDKNDNVFRRDNPISATLGLNN